MTEYKFKCSKCGLFSNTLHEIDSCLCRRIQTKTINPDKPYGEHIKLKCSKCGMKGWSTKNIDCIGARTIFFNLEMKPGLKECDCPGDFLVVDTE